MMEEIGAQENTGALAVANYEKYNSVAYRAWGNLFFILPLKCS